MKIFFKNIFYSFILAFSFFTRLPLNFIKVDNIEKRISNTFVFFPVVGLFFGLVLFYSEKLFVLLKLSIDLQSILLIMIPYILNKFLHFDGLCDTADSFLADKSKKERLKILKDSGIGSFALGTIVIFILLKFQVLKEFLLDKNLINYLIMVPVYSRFSMVLMSFKSNYPRKQGTGSFFIGRLNSTVLFITAMIFSLINFIFIIFSTSVLSNLFLLIIILIFTVSFVFLFKFYSYKKINGVTGDVLGALNELTELLIIILLVVISNFLKARN